MFLLKMWYNVDDWKRRIESSGLGKTDMYRLPSVLPDIAEADEEPDDTLSSASTASFWGHEREIADPWWRITPPTAASLRTAACTPPLYRGLIRTTPTKPKTFSKYSHRSYSYQKCKHKSQPEYSFAITRKRTSSTSHSSKYNLII